MEFKVFIHAVDVVEYVLDDARDDSLQVAIPQHPLHCVRLSRRCLAVREDRAVVPTEYIWKETIQMLQYFIANSYTAELRYVEVVGTQKNTST